MPGKRWHSQTHNRESGVDPYPQNSINWKRDGLWDLLHVRARAILAAAFSERTWQKHPWPTADWERIANALNRVLSLCLQAEGTVNDIPLKLRPFCLTVKYAGINRPAEIIYRNGSPEQVNAGFEASTSDGSLSVSCRWMNSDTRVFRTFEEVVEKELTAQLNFSTDPHDLWAREEITNEVARTEADRLWDLRVRFTDFMRRFLLVLREKPVHPFVAFLLEPKHMAKVTALDGSHLRSGLFGYGYALDRGQIDYLKAKGNEDRISVFTRERVEFPWGECSQVYLRGRATDPHDSDRAKSESPVALAGIEGELLQQSTLMEIAVLGTPWMYEPNAPDGPEFILCVCLPKGQAAPDAATIAPDRVTTGVAHSIAERVRLATQAPVDSQMQSAEVQTLREMGQKLLSKYASAFGARLQLLTDAAAVVPSQHDSVRVYGRPIPKLIGNSRSLDDVRKCIEQGCDVRSTVLVLGETGVGKEVVARAFHELSPWSSAAFVSVNCAALPKDLVESELFGHVSGAFSGAVRLRAGKFAHANRGTIFLDEIADMPLETQAKVLRVLQEREFEPLGSENTITVDVRVVAATNKDLQAEIAAGRFREDLYYRLDVIRVVVPPLRERREDIPMLIEHLCARHASQKNLKIRPFTVKAVLELQNYHWPGNVRQLENCLEKLLIVTSGSNISDDDVRAALRSSGARHSGPLAPVDAAAPQA